METKAEFCKNHRNALYPEHKGSSPTALQSSWMAQHCRANRNPTRLIWGWRWTDNSPSNSTLRHCVAKVASRNNLLRRLAGIFLGSLHKYSPNRRPSHSSTALQNMLPQPWCRSTHCKKKLDVTLNDTMRIINGCLTTNPSEIPPCPLGNCSTCTS